MTHLRLVRDDISPTRTLGKLFVDDVYECETLEDTVRPAGDPKVPGATAIPAGTYPVRIAWSDRFRRAVPHVLNVPGFDSIEIHPGNTAADTAGCPLVGTVRAQDAVIHSREAFEKLMEKIAPAPTCAITVVDPPLKPSDECC